MKIKQFFLILSSALLFFSCAKENEDLVNPPSKAESVKVRFLNLAGDKAPRTLVYHEMESTGSVNYGSASEAINPPADSAYIDIEKNGSIEYETKTLIKFIRNSYYTFISLPSKQGAEEERPVDTIMYFRTTSAVDRYSTDAYVKFFNAVNDTTVSYTLKIGCPNGTTVKSNAGYMQTMLQPKQIRSGVVPFSLIKNEGGELILIDLYEVDLKPKKQYLFTVMIDDAGNENLLVLEEETEAPSAAFFAKIVEQRNTQVRALNFTGDALSYERKGEGNFINSLSPNTLSDYQSIEVCRGADQDTIIANKAGEPVSLSSLSLEVLEKYSLMTFEQETNQYINITAEPLKLKEETGDSAIIRVVNGNFNYEGLTVALGARSSGTPGNFISGKYLAQRLPAGDISNHTLNESGTVPVVVFTSTTPAELLYSTQIKIKPKKEYLLILSHDEQNSVKVTAVEEEQDAAPVDYKPLGSFIQAINATYDQDTVSVTIEPPLLDGADLPPAGSLASVVQEGQGNIAFNGVSSNFNAETNKRILSIAFGNSDEPETFTVNTEPMDADRTNYFWRFVNVSSRNQVGIKLHLEDDVALALLDQLTVTPPKARDRSKSQTIYFMDMTKEEPEVLYQVSDVKFNLGKNYTIIFTGDNKDNFNTVIQQEF